MKSIRSAILALIGISFSASAQWERVVLTLKGNWTDIPSPQTLRYFTANPFLRDDAHDLCRRCTPEGKAESAKKFSVRTEVKPAGTLAGYRILNVLYYPFEREKEDAGPYNVKWKSILVSVAPGRYKEIFHHQAYNSGVSLTPARIVQSGEERVLATMDRDGGNGGGCWEAYWWFDRTGPHRLDFSRLEQAIRKRVPDDATFQMLCTTLNLEAQEVRTWVQRTQARCHACDYLGTVTARFRLDGPIVRPLEVQFKPEDPQ